MAEDEQHDLDPYQGRWQVGDDFVVVEADQVCFLGDKMPFGNIVPIEGTANEVTFVPSDFATEDGIVAVTGTYTETQDSTTSNVTVTIEWQDGDTWRKLNPEEFSTCLTTLDAETEERRWTKQGQKGSDIERAQKAQKAEGQA